MLQVVKNKIITSDVVDVNVVNVNDVMKRYYHMQVDNAVCRSISHNLYVVGPILPSTRDTCFFDVYNGNRMVYYASIISCKDGSFKLCLNYSLYEHFDIHVLMRIVKFVSLTMRQCGLKPKEVFLKIDARYGDNLPFILKTFKRLHA
jgi:hypothetical protein